MFAALRFKGRKRLFYRPKAYLRQCSFGYFTEVISPPLKNKKQRQKLCDYLSNYDGRIVYEKGFSEKELCLKPYSAADFINHVLIRAFFEYCKNIRPPCAVIKPSGKLRHKFYFNLSQYTGRIVILGEDTDYKLCSDILEHSGTPVFFDSAISTGAVLLNLSNEALLCGGLYSARFEKDIIKKAAEHFTINEPIFKGLEPITLSAVLAEKFNRRDLIDKWAEAVNKQYF